MRMKFISKIIVMISLTLSSLNSYAQYASIEELKSTANKLFQEEDYEGSLQLYAQLLSTYPKDPIYNYKYGACVLFGSRDKEDALRFLEFATTKPNVDPIAFYFLGKSYHHEFKFSKAIESYNLFKAKASSKELNKYDVDREIEMCQNGKNLLKNILSIGVLGKKETKESDFFRSYSLKGIGGNFGKRNSVLYKHSNLSAYGKKLFW